MLATGGSPLAALVGGLLVNARHLPFGLAVADVIGRGPARLLAAHLLVDESVAFALAQPDPRRARLAFWTSGVALFVSWQVGVLAGSLAAGRIADPDALGIDAAFPAALLALVLPGLRERVPRRVALAGAALAATALLAALIVTAALTEGTGFPGWARPAGVAVGAVAAWRRGPFVAVVLLAAVTTAGLRALGVP